MRCPHCQFENMPDQTACFRCGSVLDGKALAVDVHPPRAPGWKKPFRRAGRWTRRRWAARKAVAAARRAEKAAAAAAGGWTDDLSRFREDLPRWVELRRALWETFVALALSILPGGAHLLRHRFRTIYIYVIAWFMALALGIFFFGSRLGNEAVSVAVVLHAWIVMDAVMLFEKFKEYLSMTARIAARLAGVALLAALIYPMYGAIWDVAMPGLVVAQSGIAVPAQAVELRDSILCRALTDEPPLIKRGDLVLVTVFEIGYGPGRSGQTVGQLIGLPGDTVKVTKDPVFIVNNQSLDPDKFPVPHWLQGRELTDTLGKQTYFVTMEYQIAGHGAALAPGAVVHACEFRRDQLLARGEFLWSPLRRRGSLKELE